MKRQFTTRPANQKVIAASSIDGVTWDDIWQNLKDAEMTLYNFVQYSDSDIVWDTYVEAHNAGDSDKAHQLLQASKQLNEAVHVAMSTYERQVKGIQAGDYTRIED
jgi:hypothetical protein